MENKKREHVILFPFLAKGHFTAFLGLAQLIEKQRGCDITVLNTPINVKYLKSMLPLSSSIQCREISFNSSEHGLPPNTESTDNLPLSLIHRLLEASACLKPGFRKLVAEIVDECSPEPHSAAVSGPSIYIISDIFFGWTAEIAREFDIFHSIFAAFSGFGLALYYSLWTNAPHWKVEGAEDFSDHDFPEAGKIHMTQMPPHLLAADGTDIWSVILRKKLLECHGSDAILFNTVEGIDEVGLAYFRRKLGSTVYAIGPVLMEKERIRTHDCLDWLDTKPPRSVIYVSFGSQNTLAAAQMMELAMALEAAKRPFIWVVRPPLGIDYRSEFRTEDWLPKGFEERIQELQLGILVRNWAPQLEILSHKSVGGFISHCGWNSILEAVTHEIPILGWPMSAEQFFNAKFLEGETLGVCVELARGNRVEVKQDDIVKKINMVMGENIISEKIRKRTCEVKNILGDAREDTSGHKGTSVQAMDEFFKAARQKS